MLASFLPERGIISEIIHAKYALLSASPQKILKRINTFLGWSHEEHDCSFPAEHMICL